MKFILISLIETIQREIIYSRGDHHVDSTCEFSTIVAWYLSWKQPWSIFFKIPNSPCWIRPVQASQIEA